MTQKTTEKSRAPTTKKEFPGTTSNTGRSVLDRTINNSPLNEPSIRGYIPAVETDDGRLIIDRQLVMQFRENCKDKAPVLDRCIKTGKILVVG